MEEGLEHTICFSVLCCNVLLVLDNGCKLMQRVLCAEVESEWKASRQIDGER